MKLDKTQENQLVLDLDRARLEESSKARQEPNIGSTFPNNEI